MIKNIFLFLATILFYPFLRLRIFLNKISKTKKLKFFVIDTGKIGDLVNSTPVFREIKKHFPESELLVGIREQSYGVIQNNIYIDKFIFLNSSKYKNFLGKIKLIHDIKKEKISWSINLSPHAFNTILSLWSACDKRATLTSKYTGKLSIIFSYFNNYRLKYEKHNSKLRKNLELLKFFNINNPDEKKEIFIGRTEQIKANIFLSEKRLKEKDFIIGISITAGNKIKEWGKIKFAQLADKLVKEFCAKIIFFGSDKDIDDMNIVASLMDNKSIISTDFKTNELAAIFKKIKIFIAVDTGPLYVAHAVGVPVVDITGPCDIDEQPPRDSISELVYEDLYCRPCSFVIPPARFCKEGHLRCTKDITVNKVFFAAKKLIEEIYGRT